MNARDLIERLEAVDPETEIRLMEQPSWPFEYEIAGTWEVFMPDGCNHFAYEEDSDKDDDFGYVCTNCGDRQVGHSSDGFVPHGDPTQVLYLVEGRQLAYGTKEAWTES